jgi:hypothetical protein
MVRCWHVSFHEVAHEPDVLYTQSHYIWIVHIACCRPCLPAFQSVILVFFKMLGLRQLYPEVILLRKHALRSHRLSKMCSMDWSHIPGSLTSASVTGTRERMGWRPLDHGKFQNRLCPIVCLCTAPHHFWSVQVRLYLTRAWCPVLLLAVLIVMICPLGLTTAYFFSLLPVCLAYYFLIPSDFLLTLP